MAANPTNQTPNLFSVDGGYSSFEPVTEAPAAITDLSIDSIGSTSAILSWTLPANTENVRVYKRDVTADGPFNLIETLGAVETYNAPGLDPENQYEWYVVASNAIGDSGDSNVVSGTTTAQAGDPDGNIFNHGFEDASYEDSVTAEGAGWDRGLTTTTSIVRDDQYVVANDQDDTFAEPLGPISDREWEGSPLGGGTHALRFRYAAGNAGQSELRFTLGSHEEPDVWLRWDLRVPINHLHESVGGGADNNKILRLWHTDYSGPGAKVGMEFREDGSGGSVFYLNAADNGTGSAQISVNQPFAVVPDDRGRWMRLIFHAMCETSAGASDGVIQCWRKWEDEGGYTLVHEETGLGLVRGDGTVAGFNVGYLMGYANSGYNSDTEWLLDNFTISSEALI